MVPLDKYNLKVLNFQRNFQMINLPYLLIQTLEFKEKEIEISKNILIVNGFINPIILKKQLSTLSFIFIFSQMIFTTSEN